MHSKKTKEVIQYIEKLYKQHKPQEQKFKLTWCSEHISNIIKTYE